MARLPQSEVVRIAAERGLEILDVVNYVNLQSKLTFKCAEGHTFECDTENLRKLYGCPQCDQRGVKFKKEPPKKSGFRIVGFDQATKNFGVSIFDGGALTYFDVLQFEGETQDRLVKVGKTVAAICEKWEPDYIVYEDIQQQGSGGYNTFKLLAELKGIVGYEISCAGIENTCVLNKVWQAMFNIKGRNRIEQKLSVIEKVKFYYPTITGITDDAADAILLGKYGVQSRLSSGVPQLF